LIVYAIGQTDLFDRPGNAHTADSPTGSDKIQTLPTYASKTPLYILTASGITVIYASSGSSTVLSLGLSYAVLTASALWLLQNARVEAQQPAQNGGSVIYSANGFLSQHNKRTVSGYDVGLCVARDVSAAAALGTSIAAVALESLSIATMLDRGILGDIKGEEWVMGQLVRSAAYSLGMVVVHIIMNASLLAMVRIFPSLNLCKEGISPCGARYARVLIGRHYPLECAFLSRVASMALWRHFNNAGLTPAIPGPHLRRVHHQLRATLRRTVRTTHCQPVTQSAMVCITLQRFYVHLPG
jgi:hypothetical protein